LRTPKHSQDKTKLGETILTQIVYSKFTSISMSFYMSQAPLFIVFRRPDLRWEISNESHLKMAPKPSHMEDMTLFLLLISPTLLSTPTFYVLFKNLL